MNRIFLPTRLLQTTTPQTEPLSVPVRLTRIRFLVSILLVLSTDSDRRMADQVVICTIKSHGAKVARTHMYDWLILLLLVVIEAILLIIEPFHRFVGVDMMADMKYPLKGNTVPFWAVPLLAIMLPFVVILIFYFRHRDVYDLHHAILGLLFSVLLTAVITDSIKDAVGRPRPDFFYRCFPDGNATFNPITKDVMCNGDKAVIKEGYKSFPSGHTSWSFAGLGFLAWYLSGKIRAFDRKGHVAKLGIVLLPCLVAALVGVSRVDDYWHHWQDVFTGALIGTVVSTFCYLQFFPMPYDTNGWAPHAYFRMIEESNRGGGSAQPGNSLQVRRTEVETSYLGANDGLGGGEYGARDRTTMDIEAGRRR